MVTVTDQPEAHLINLRPPARRPGRAVIGLPMPPVCRLMAPEAFADLQRRELARVAQAVGGGDAPAPAWQLQPESDLLQALDHLAAQGVQRLTLVGAPDQPEMSREVQARWSGAVHPWRGPEASLLARLMGGPPSWTVAPGVVRVLPGASAVEPGVQALQATPEDEPPVARNAYVLDPERQMGAWSGIAPLAARRVDEAGARAREAWRDRWPDAVFSAAVLGLSPDLEQMLAPREPRPVPLPARRSVITGTDGAGKSTHVQRLAASLHQQGARVAIIKLYRQGAFLELADELSGRVGHGAPMSAFVLSRVVKLADSLRVLDEVLRPAAARCDVLLLDRWVETHRAAAESQLGWDLTDHPALTIYPGAHRTAWLLLPPEEAVERLQRRGGRLTADEHAAGIEGYARCFERWSRGPGHLRVDATESLATNISAIADHLAFDGPLRCGEAPPPEAPVMAPPVALSAESSRCLVTVGAATTADAGAGVPTLGADLLRLRGLGQLHHASVGFWLSAWSAQVLLDVRQEAPAVACAPLWPPAVVRAWPDLEAIHEVAALLEDLTEVTAWAPPPLDLFAPLASSAGARRLHTAYTHALKAIAAEAGWPRQQEASR